MFVIDQVFLFANSKCKRYFHNRLKPSKLTWTAMYRKQHKKVNIMILNDTLNLCVVKYIYVYCCKFHAYAS